MNTSDDMADRMARAMAKAYRAGDKGLLVVKSISAESEDSYAVDLLAQAGMMYHVSGQRFRLTQNGITAAEAAQNGPNMIDVLREKAQSLSSDAEVADKLLKLAATMLGIAGVV